VRISRGAELRLTDLSNADLRGADLRDAQFVCSNLRGARLEQAIAGRTHFGFTPLREVHGVEEIVHASPSTADLFTLVHSPGLPDSFYAACRTPDHVRRLVAVHAQQFYKTCFISYSRRDEGFVKYFREALTWYGVPSWFAQDDMRDESHLEDRVELERDLFTFIDESELVLLIVSPNILTSSWVGKEVARAWGIRPIIPILIDTMPHPDSELWKAGILATTPPEPHSAFVPEVYSQRLVQLLSGPMTDMRLWRDPLALGTALPPLLTWLRRSPQ
jgi:hypothetical protein